MSELALGTAQFGLEYGVTNKRGKIQKDEIKAILDYAILNKVDLLDTAKAYGKSEEILGEVIGGDARFKIVTKIEARGDKAALEKEVAFSLSKLRRTEIYGCLLHSFSAIQENQAVLNYLADIRAGGCIEKIGVSLYHPEEALYLLDNSFPFDLVQVPYNLLDRRFSKIFDRLQTAGIEIHVRSVFLQGILLVSPEKLPPHFRSVQKAISKIHNKARGAGLSPETLCLGLAAADPRISRVVVGVDGLASLKANIDAFKRWRETLPLLEALDDISSSDEEIILPFKWSL